MILSTLAILATGIALTGPAAAKPLVAFDRFNVQAGHRAAPLAAGIWSPVGADLPRNGSAESSLPLSPRASLRSSWRVSGRHGNTCHDC